MAFYQANPVSYLSVACCQLLANLICLVKVLPRPPSMAVYFGYGDWLMNRIMYKHLLLDVRWSPISFHVKV